MNFRTFAAFVQRTKGAKSFSILAKNYTKIYSCAASCSALLSFSPLDVSTFSNYTYFITSAKLLEFHQIHQHFLNEKLFEYNSPILTIPWFVISQQDCNFKIFNEVLCFGEKNPKAASVTWYACNENSHSDGKSCATAPIASSEIFTQSANFNDIILGDRQAHNPPSLKSLQQNISNSYSAYRIETNWKHIKQCTITPQLAEEKKNWDSVVKFAFFFSSCTCLFFMRRFDTRDGTRKQFISICYSLYSNFYWITRFGWLYSVAKTIN